MLGGITARAEATNSAWLVRTWQTDDGLPENRVYDVAQSPDGFLWVATRGGLVRFDGLVFQGALLGRNPNVPKRETTALHFDGRGRLWLGYKHGAVVCLEPNAVRAYGVKGGGVPDQQIGSFAEDADGTVIASYKNADAIGWLRIRDGKPEAMAFGQGLAATNHWQIVSGKQGEVWAATGKSVGLLRNGQFRELAHVDGQVFRIAAARNGGIWIATAQQLLKLEGGRPPEEKGQLPQDVSEVSALLEDRVGAVWIGTINTGLLRFSGGQCERIETVPREIECLAEDQEGSIWVGTLVGLYQLRLRSLELLASSDGVSFESVLSVAEQVETRKDAAARLWVVTEDGRVVRQEGASWAVVSSQAGWPGGSATSIAADPQGAIWIATTGARLHRFEDGQFHSWGSSDGLARGEARSLFISSGGDVWIALFRPEGLQRLRNGTFQTFHMSGPKSAQRVRAMVEDKAGNIWVGTAAGQLLRVDGDQLVRELGSRNELFPSIRCLWAMQDGSLWIGCGGSGLARLKAGQLTHIATAAGLSEDYISQMALDGAERLWCAGARSIFQVPLQELTAVAEGRAERVRAVVYGRGEGLKNLQSNERDGTGALRRRNGELWFPMRNGLVVVPPTIVRDSHAPAPRVLLESVMVDGQPVATHDRRSPLLLEANLLDLSSVGAAVPLRPNYRKLEFNFCAPSFVSPRNVNYRYRLEGFEEDWVEVGAQRNVSYPKLPAGGYRFLVTACSEDGVWSQDAAIVKLTVTPFFWQATWFRWGLLVLFTLSVVGLVRYVSYRRLHERMGQVERQAALDQERARIARDMHDTLGASLTQMNILGALASREGTPLEEVRAQVGKITGSSQALVLQLDEIVWAVDPENDTLDGLATYISQFATEFFADLPIRCRTRAPALLPAVRLTTQVRHNLFLAVKEALNNVARHSGATEATVSLAAEDNTLSISIEDNGRGFEVAAATHGHGLTNLKQRLGEVGGTCRIESRPGAGTQITLVWRWQSQ